MKAIKNTYSTMAKMLRSAVLVPLSLAYARAHAAVYGGGGVNQGISDASGLGGISNISSVRELIVRIITFILDIVLLLAVVAIVIAGIYLITSNGEEGQKDKAKRIIYYALIGVVVVLLSRTIVTFVNSIF